ncbi:thioredoxin domain-containing protein [Sneathiella aquimaris]|uniref:hypothetical protein n=1 Tax=Sneathiella aquimaris TaxID=2599305 RepID=UPI002260FC0C|nr:hypothetical protein [Sneathiella aquimaris]
MNVSLLTGTVVGFFLFFAMQINPLAAAELLMFRERGCYWCEKWDEEIGPIYPKTSEGKTAPLKQRDIQDPIEEFITHNGIVHYTPTFVLVEGGREIGRITGYPGEDNFWWMLEELVKKLKPNKAGTKG